MHIQKHAMLYIRNVTTCVQFTHVNKHCVGMQVFHFYTYVRFHGCVKCVRHQLNVVHLSAPGFIQLFVCDKLFIICQPVNLCIMHVLSSQPTYETISKRNLYSYQMYIGMAGWMEALADKVHKQGKHMHSTTLLHTYFTQPCNAIPPLHKCIYQIVEGN